MSVVDEEEELLRSIYPTEFTRPSATTFRIQIEIGEEEGAGAGTGTGTGASACMGGVVLTVGVGDGYPDAPPDVHVEYCPSGPGSGSGSSGTGSSGTETELTSEEKEDVMRTLQNVVAESLGTQMTFTLAATLKDRVLTLLDARTHAATKHLEDERLAEAALERRKFEGTKVSADSFEAWKARFSDDLLSRIKRAKVAAHLSLLRKSGAGGAGATGTAGAAGAGAGGAGGAGGGGAIGNLGMPMTGRQMFEGDTTLNQSDVQLADETVVPRTSTASGETKLGPAARSGPDRAAKSGTGTGAGTATAPGTTTGTATRADDLSDVFARFEKTTVADDFQGDE